MRRVKLFLVQLADSALPAPTVPEPTAVAQQSSGHSEATTEGMGGNRCSNRTARCDQKVYLNYLQKQTFISKYRNTGELLMFKLTTDFYDEFSRKMKKSKNREQCISNLQYHSIESKLQKNFYGQFLFYIEYRNIEINFKIKHHSAMQICT